MTTAPVPCRWCRQACRRHRGGSPRVFCTSACRIAFHSAARRWAERAVSLGKLTVADLKADPAACTLFPAAVSPPADPKAGTLGDALLDLVDDILIELSVEERDKLPAQVWKLIDAIIGAAEG